MGIIKAGVDAVAGAAAEQWKEFFVCDEMGSEILISRAIRQGGADSANQGSYNIITEGSLIVVGEGEAAIVTENGKIVGSGSLGRLPRRMSHRGDLSVSVLKSHWRRGIGGLLIEALLNFAKENGFSVIDLQVRSDHPAAIHLYEKYGFTKIGTHPYFFRIDGTEVSVDYMCLQLR